MIDVLHAPAGSIFTGKMIKDWIRENLGKDGPEGEAAGRVELYLRLCNDDQTRSMRSIRKRKATRKGSTPWNLSARSGWQE